MTARALGVALGLALLPLHIAMAKAKAKDDPTCSRLRAFVASVKPDEHRTLVFRTHWGGSFNDDAAADPDTFVFYSKRCEHHDYGPAKAACDALMAHGAVEFADINFKEALQCLSPQTRLDAGVEFGDATVSLTYGNDDVGAHVDLDFREDPKVGGMVLTVTADGY